MLSVDPALAVALVGMVSTVSAYALESSASAYTLESPASASTLESSPSASSAAPAPSGTPFLDNDIIVALDALGKTPSDFRLPGSRPYPNLPAGTDMLPGIENIITIMLENQAFDHMWGLLNRSGVNVFPIDDVTGKPVAVNPFANGTLLRAYPMSMTCQRTPGADGPTQNWGSTHVQIDNGAVDGFVVGNGNLTNGNKTIAMSYVTPDQLPFIYDIGRTFPICDSWYGSAPGQTTPNRMYLIGGTSLGITTTGQNITGTLVPEAHSYYAILDEYNITWRQYVPSFNKPGSQPTLRFFPADNATALAHGADQEQFFVDAAAGNLPQYSFIDVNGTFQSQEAPQNLVNGEAFFYEVVQALAASPQWNKSLLIFIYDEHGGYYDHMPPPVALAPDFVAPIPPPGYSQYDGFKRYSFRVPSAVISPYSKKDHVVHSLHDHTSVLALLSRKWNLPSKTYRDANANDMTDFIDLEALEQRRPNFPDLRLLNLSRPGNTTEALACSNQTNNLVPPPEAYQQATYNFPD